MPGIMDGALARGLGTGRWAMRACGCAWAMTAPVGCFDRGSLGNYEGGSSTVADATDSSGADSGADHSSTAGSTTDPTGPRCGGEGCQMFASPCGDDCGALESPFDAAGCLRTQCSDDGQCSDGEVCFVAQDFGLCAGSGWYCEDSVEDAACICSSDPSCSGGFCVPDSLYPGLQAAPAGAAAIVVGCADEFGDRFTFTVYDTEMLTGCEPSMAGLELLELDLGGTVEPGSMRRTASESFGVLHVDGQELAVWTASFDISAVSESTGASGSYELLVLTPEGTPMRFQGEYADAPVCQTLAPCG